MSSNRLNAWLVGAFVIAVAWLASDHMPPPWPCRYDELDRHPLALALMTAARAACMEHSGQAEVDLDTIWRGDWSRLHFFRPYHGNHDVIARVGPELEIMACTRSRNADEWTQAVVESRSGRLHFFDLPTHLLDDPPPLLERGHARLGVRCDYLAAMP